jgi:hypothetical protein
MDELGEQYNKTWNAGADFENGKKLGRNVERFLIRRLERRWNILAGSYF